MLVACYLIEPYIHTCRTKLHYIIVQCIISLSLSYRSGSGYCDNRSILKSSTGWHKKIMNSIEDASVVEWPVVGNCVVHQPLRTLIFSCSWQNDRDEPFIRAVVVQVLSLHAIMNVERQGRQVVRSTCSNVFSILRRDKDNNVIGLKINKFRVT